MPDISDLSDATDHSVERRALIESVNYNAEVADFKARIDALNDVVADLENNYKSTSEPGDKPEGKIFSDITDDPALLKYYQDAVGTLQTLVGLTLTQTLTNKTLTTPVLNTATMNTPIMSAITGDITITGNLQATTGIKIARNENLIVEYVSVTTVDINAEVLTLFDSNGYGLVIEDWDLTADITTSGAINGRDIANGTISEKTSTWYGIWAIYNGTTKASLLVANMEGTCDANTLNKLTDSGENFNDEGVEIGDRIYQTTDSTMGYVGAIDSNTVISCVDSDGTALDLFPDGNETFIIERLSPTMPTGYTFKKYLGSVYNDSGDDFDPFTQHGNEVNTLSLTIESGNANGGAQSSNLQAFVPTTAITMKCRFYVTDAGGGAYDGVATINNPAGSQFVYTGIGSTGISSSQQFFLYDTMKFYWTKLSGDSIDIHSHGYTLNVI